MTCKYAWRNGYVNALERVREFVNKKAEEAKQLSESETYGKAYWWRAQGQFDITHELLYEIGTLIGKDNE